MNAKTWSHDECLAESLYIQHVNPTAPGRAFNHNPECFARYCNMQANHIRKCGYPLIAHDVLQARDIANPQFRSEALNAGKTIENGLWVDLS